jgi:hypothetical protein
VQALYDAAVGVEGHDAALVKVARALVQVGHAGPVSRPGVPTRVEVDPVDRNRERDILRDDDLYRLEQ